MQVVLPSFCLFLPFTRRNAVALASCKKEEGSFNFGHETGFKLQKPGHNTSAYIFFLIRELFYSSETSKRAELPDKKEKVSDE